MPKRKKVKKVRKPKKIKKTKFKNLIISSAKLVQNKNSVPGPDEKPEIKKIKKQATEKRIYNIKTL